MDCSDKVYSPRILRPQIQDLDRAELGTLHPASQPARRLTSICIPYLPLLPSFASLARLSLICCLTFKDP
jgi:hypothetical protein